MKLTLEIPGVPIAKKRPRFWAKAIGNGKVKSGTYKDEKEATAEGRFLWEVHRQLPPDWAPYGKDVPLKVEVWFFRPIPASFSKKKLQAIAAGQLFPTSKPDNSNAVKFFEDCLNGLVWHDDAQIVEGPFPHKRYSDRPRTEITVEAIC